MKALLDLFARHRSRDTGVWTLGHDPQRTIYLEGGQIAFAQSTHPLDRMTTLLVERGKLTQAQLDYALQNLKPGLSIGRNLIEMGFITQRDLLEIAKAQVERVVWGAMGDQEEEPRFQSQALDASVVRLSLDTPLTLLIGCLHLRDRERLLEVLGPLEQKLQLETHLDLNLPPDLAKVPALLDGQRRLLELAQETGVEPMRLGAFALFLREMGWAQLRFGPGEAEAEPAKVEWQPPAPSLVASIEAAERPTVDLHHLTGSLDALDQGVPPVPPRELDPEALPDLHLHADPMDPVESPEETPRTSSRKSLWLLMFMVIAGGGVYAGWRWTQTPQTAASAVQGAAAPKPESEVLTPSPALRDLPPVPGPSPTAPPTLPAAPAPSAPPAQTTAAKAPEPAADSRWSTLKRADWDAALKEGAAHKAALKDAWVLRLEVACQPETLNRAVAAFRAPADIFLVPMAMKDGRTCRQVCFGHFGSEAEAQAAIPGLPPLFREGGNKPHPFQASALPEKQ